MRDPTRGGLAATLVEIAGRRGLGVQVDERAIPVRGVVRGACEILGLDPPARRQRGQARGFRRGSAERRGAGGAAGAIPLGAEACRIGRVVEEHPGRVLLRTPIGGDRVLELPFGEALPRIC